MNTETNTELGVEVNEEQATVQPEGVELEVEVQAAAESDTDTNAQPSDDVDRKDRLIDALKEEKRNLSLKNRQIAQELEAARAELEAVKQEKEELKNFHLRAPLVKLANEISPLPDVFLAEFQRFYKIDMVDDEIQIFTLDGERFLHNADRHISRGGKSWVEERDGDPVKFEEEDIWRALTNLRDKAQRERWACMIRGTRAVGMGATGGRGVGPSRTTPSTSAAPTKTPGLGLR